MVDEKKEDTLPNQDANAGVQLEADEKIKRANLAAQRLEEATKKAEAIRVNEILGGRSEAGKQEKPKELTPKEYAKLALDGKLPPKI